MAIPEELLPIYERIREALNRLRGYRDPDKDEGLQAFFAETAAGYWGTGAAAPAITADVRPYTVEEVSDYIDSWVAVFEAENPRLFIEGLLAGIERGEHAGILARQLFVGLEPSMYGRPEGYFAREPGVLNYADTAVEGALIEFSWDVQRQMAAFPDAPTRDHQLGAIIYALEATGKISEDEADVMSGRGGSPAAQNAARDNLTSLLDEAPQIMSRLAAGRRSPTNLGWLFSSELEGLGEEAIGAELIPGWAEPGRREAEDLERAEETLASLDAVDLEDPASIVKGALPDPINLNAEEKVAYNAFVEEQTKAATERIRALLTGATRLGDMTHAQAEERMRAWAARAAHSFAGVLEDVAAQTQQDEALEAAEKERTAAQKARDDDTIKPGKLRATIAGLLTGAGVKVADLPPGYVDNLWSQALAYGIESQSVLRGWLDLANPASAQRVKDVAREHQESLKEPTKPATLGKQRLDEFLFSLGPDVRRDDLDQATIDQLEYMFGNMTEGQYTAARADDPAFNDPVTGEAWTSDLEATVRGAARRKGIEDFLGRGAALTPASAVEGAYAPGLYESLQPAAADELQDRLAAVMRGQGITDPEAAMEIVRGEVGINAFGELAPWPALRGQGRPKPGFPTLHRYVQGLDDPSWAQGLAGDIEYEDAPQVRTPQEMQAEYRQRMDPTQIPTPPGWALPGGGLGPPGGGLPSIGPRYPEMDPYFRPELGGLQFPEDEMMAALYEAAGDNPTYLRYLMEQMPDFWKSYTDLPRPGWGVDAETYGSMVAGTSPTADVGSLEELRAMLAAEEAALEGTTRTPGAFDPTLEGYPQRKARLEAQTRIRNLRDQIARLEGLSNLEYRTGSSLFDLYPDVPESEILAGARDMSMTKTTRPSAAEYFAGEESRYRRSFDMSPAGLEQQLRQEREAEQERDIAAREQEVERRSLLRQGPTVYTR